MDKTNFFILIEETLLLTEGAANSYIIYYDKYNELWPQPEKEIAKETLGTLTIFCYQLMNLWSSSFDFNKIIAAEKESLLNQIEIIKQFADGVFLQIKEFV